MFFSDVFVWTPVCIVKSLLYLSFVIEGNVADAIQTHKGIPINQWGSAQTVQI